MNHPPSERLLIEAWQRLAVREPDGTRRRANELEEIARQLINRKGVQFAADALGVVRFMVQEDREKTLAARTMELNRELAARAVSVQRELIRALESVRYLYANASERKWYFHPQSTRVNKTLARRAQQAYAHALVAAERDPLLTFLASRPFPSRPRGNPLKVRNSRIRHALRTLGLLIREVDHVLFAIGFKDQR